ncbi:MAG: AAA family ATPase [Elusimicrobia bacterium]|nr:AAA family ATPase [Elusimicrobiota bacterium]
MNIQTLAKERRKVVGLLIEIEQVSSNEKNSNDEIFGDCLHSIRQITAQYDGFIDKIFNNSVFIIFGIPERREDNPTRAILTAISVQETSKSISLKHKITVNTHACIDTGLLSSDETSAILDSLKKIAQLKIPEQIVITADIHRLTEGQFSFKGIPTETGKLYSIINALKIPAIKKHLQSRFIGRVEEFNLLKKYVERVLKGEWYVVSVVGEAGIGKSRLVRELTETYLLKKDVRLIKSRAYAFTAMEPYYMFCNILSYTFNISETDTIETINKKIADKCSVWQMNSQEVVLTAGYVFSKELQGNTTDIAFEDRKKLIFRIVKQIVFNLAGPDGKPVVFIFEDVQWADHSSIELLNMVIDSISNIPIFILCVYRTGFIHSWAAKPYYTQIFLKPLSKEETREMVSSLLEEEFLPGDISNAIIEKSEGHPLYVEEMVKTLIDEGAIVRTPFGLEVVKKLSELKLPDKVEDIISSRINILPQSVKKIIQTASVIGRKFQCKW